ncbi:DUF3515 domain-containing protein [Propionibacteriaceae bacterium Y1685]|uniref:DUF3515 domain-containing protein n=1 Tax=Microlunatus sp. Y1700 TaxID=3418487 RepID=UPI003B7AA553
MSRTARRRLRITALLAAVVACCLTACSIGPVKLTAPHPDAGGRAICAEVMAALPDRVLDRQRRSTEPADLTAAWGSPAITLRCGVDQPPGMGPTSECLEVNGVGWYAEAGEGGTLFTTLGRKINIEVGVPSRYSPEATALTDLSAAVSHDPVVLPCQ